MFFVFILELKVREQERHIALQVRREVQERKERALQSLGTTLRDEWQKQRGERIQTLEKLYMENLRAVGQGQRDAEQNVSKKSNRRNLGTLKFVNTELRRRLLFL